MQATVVQTRPGAAQGPVEETHPGAAQDSVVQTSPGEAQAQCVDRSESSTGIRSVDKSKSSTGYCCPDTSRCSSAVVQTPPGAVKAASPGQTHPSAAQVPVVQTAQEELHMQATLSRHVQVQLRPLYCALDNLRSRTCLYSVDMSQCSKGLCSVDKTKISTGLRPGAAQALCGVDICRCCSGSLVQKRPSSRFNSDPCVFGSLQQQQLLLFSCTFLTSTCTSIS